MTEIEKTQLRNLRRLSRYFDYKRSDIAESLGVEPSAVYQWFSRGKISKTGAVLAEKATKGVVTAAQLRPDIAEFEG